MTEQIQPTDALAKLRHLYANMINGGVRDTASAKRIAEGLLSPAIEALEKLGTPAGVGEPEGWITWFRTPTGSREPIYSHGPKKPSHGAELDALLRKYPLFTTPQPTQAQAGAVPLDSDDIRTYARNSLGDPAEEAGFFDGVRWAEEQHGIKGADHA
jgi:hypothetical protein